MKNIVNGIFNAMNLKDFSEMEPYMDQDIVFDFPGVEPAVGKKRVLLLLQVILRNYKEIQFDVQHIILEDNKAVAIWSNKGLTNDNTYYSNKGLTWVEFKNGKIVLLSDYFKDTSFTQKKSS